MTVIQCFGSGLHFHTLALDGIFPETGHGSLEFHPAPLPTDEEVARLLATVHRRLGRPRARRGLDPNARECAPPDPLAEESASLAGIAGASVLGPRAGEGVRRRGQELGGAVPTARGSSTSAATRCRRRWPRSGSGAAAMAASWWRCGRPDATARRILLLEPLGLLGKLAALTPRPETHMLLYHGVLAPHAAWRQRVVSFARPPGSVKRCLHSY